MEEQFPLLYFPPLGYYLELRKAENAFFVADDRYEKQTLRNRCSIYGANGKIDLSIPVIRTHGKETMLKDAKISNAEAWQQVHWRSIQSAYGRSPFFEYFDYRIEPLYLKKWDYLMDFLIESNEIILSLLKIEMPNTLADGALTPNQKVLDERAKVGAYPYENAYYQIFSDRLGFIDQLSLLDWMSHEGVNLS